VTMNDRGEPLVQPSDTLLPDESEEDIAGGEESVTEETRSEEAPSSTANA